MPLPHPTRRPLAPLVAVTAAMGAVALAGCGADSPTAAGGAAVASPATVSATAGTVRPPAWRPAASAQFSSTRTQPAGRAGQVTPVSYSRTDQRSGGVRLLPGTPPTAMLVTNAGGYNVQFVAHVQHRGQSRDTISVWLQSAPFASSRCGPWVGVPHSTSSRQAQGRQVSAMTVNFLVRVAKPTCYRLAMASSSTRDPAAVRLLARGAQPPVPTVPSITTSIWRVG